MKHANEQLGLFPNKRKYILNPDYPIPIYSDTVLSIDISLLFHVLYCQNILEINQADIQGKGDMNNPPPDHVTTHPQTIVKLNMPVIKQTLLADVHTVLDPEEFLAQNRCVQDDSTEGTNKTVLFVRTVPTYIDRSDDVAWMLGCSLILFTIQVSKLIRKYPHLIMTVYRQELPSWSLACALSKMKSTFS